MDEAVEAIVVGRTDLGETDRIVRLLTPDRGRIDMLARGARASRRRFAGALEPGTRLRVSWRRGKGELATLVAADVLGAPRRARDDYARIVLVAYGCEVLSCLSEQALASEKGFGLLEAWLDLLEGEERPASASRVALEAKALTFAGLTPRLTHCAHCGGPLSGEAVFDMEAGGGAHFWCGRGAGVDAADLAGIEALRRTPLSSSPGRHVAPAARWLLTDFIEYQVRRALRSRTALDEGGPLGP